MSFRASLGFVAVLIIAACNSSHDGGSADAGGADSAARDAGGGVMDAGFHDSGPRDGGSRDAAVVPLDAPETTCSELVALPIGAPCVGATYCPGGCLQIRCLHGIVIRKDACEPDAGSCDFEYADSCGTDSDCAAVWYPDCCGGAMAHGLEVGEVEAFAQYASRCAPEPTCECLSGLTDQEGQTVTRTDEVAARCVAGRCLARKRGCGGDGDCAVGEVCCYPCGTPGCENRCTAPCMDGPGCAGGCPLLP